MFLFKFSCLFHTNFPNGFYAVCMCFVVVVIVVFLLSLACYFNVLSYPVLLVAKHEYFPVGWREQPNKKKDCICKKLYFIFFAVLVLCLFFIYFFAFCFWEILLFFYANTTWILWNNSIWISNWFFRCWFSHINILFIHRYINICVCVCVCVYVWIFLFDWGQWDALCKFYYFIFCYKVK